MPDLYALIATFVAETRNEISAARADGTISVSEAFQLFAAAVERLVKAASELAGHGADKKTAVMAAIDKLYDTLIAPIDIPYIPELIEASVVDPALKKLVLAAADGMVEFFVAKLPKPA